MARLTNTRDTISSGCTCFRLRKAARCVTQIYDQHLGLLGLTVTQYSLLGHIRVHDGIAIGALAERLIMDPTTLTRNLKPLERRGLVALARDPNDRRSRRLHLTDEGRSVFIEAKPLWARAQRQVEDALGNRGASALDAALDRAIERLTQ
jgi:DNA-binding MarR family transcriptional regulator